MLYDISAAIINAMGRRMIFTLSDQTADAIETLQKNCGLKSLAEVVRQAVGLMSTINAQSLRGYTELIMRNPKLGREREVIIPSWNNE
jgi:hypothetical protein